MKYEKELPCFARLQEEIFGIRGLMEPLMRLIAGWLLLAVLGFIMVLLFGFVRGTEAAELVRPFFSRNLNPFVQIYGLPAAEGASLAGQGNLEARFVFEVANSFTDDVAGGERIVIRGETYRSALAIRYGVGEKLEIGIDLPHVHHSRGHLNDFISDWHDTFGMPQGGRDKATDDSLDFRFAESGNNLISVAGSASGIGDVLFSAALPVWGNGGSMGRRLAVRASLKLPTGEASELLGSGSTDVSLRLCGEDPQAFARTDIALFGSLGALFMTEGDVIEDRQRQAVGFGTAGLGWQPLSWLALQLQVDAHSAFYDSSLTQLGDFSSQLIVGGTLGFPADFRLDLAVSEDIAVDTAPDVVFHFNLSRPF